MRLSSHLSSSTFSTGMLEAARVNPALRRRVASSRPRRCGIETTRGADIFGSSTDVTRCNPAWFEIKSRTGPRQRKDGTLWVPAGFFRRGRSNSAHLPGRRKRFMSIGTIILIILVIALLGGFSGIGGGPFFRTGYYCAGGGGLVLPRRSVS